MKFSKIEFIGGTIDKVFGEDGQLLLSLIDEECYVEEFTSNVIEVRDFEIKGQEISYSKITRFTFCEFIDREYKGINYRIFINSDGETCAEQVDEYNDYDETGIINGNKVKELHHYQKEISWVDEI